MPSLLQKSDVLSACDAAKYYQRWHYLLCAYVARGSSFGSALACPNARCPPGVHPTAPRLTWARQKGSARTIRP